MDHLVLTRAAPIRLSWDMRRTTSPGQNSQALDRLEDFRPGEVVRLIQDDQIGAALVRAESVDDVVGSSQDLKGGQHPVEANERVGPRAASAPSRGARRRKQREAKLTCDTARPATAR